MKKRNWWFVSIFVILALMKVDSFSFAQDNAETRSTLKGLKGFYVVMGELDPEIEKEGLIAGQFEKDTERQLRNGGIKIIPEKEYSRLKRSPNYPVARLELFAKIIKVEGTELKIFYIAVQVRQMISLVRKPAIKIFATTWENPEMGQSNSAAVIRDRVKGLVGQFIDAFLSVNE